VRQWLARNPRWTFHFTPTSASWLNAVEGFFATLAKPRLKRGIFRSVADLQADQSTITTPIPNPSNASPIQTKLSPPSNQGIKCRFNPLSRNLDPACLVLNTAMPDLYTYTCRRYRWAPKWPEAQSRRPLICTPKQRLVAELHPNGTVAPKDLDRSTNRSAFERPTADSDLSISIGETCSVSRGDDSVLPRK
jgi:hypothetical protein